MTIKLDVVTAEKVVFSADVDEVIAPGVEGQLGVLPHHTPLMTELQVGELRVKQKGEEISMSIAGGFIEVRPDRVIVLADVAERAEDIDIERAEAARRRAEERLKHPVPAMDMARAEAALQRAMIRLKVAGKGRKSSRPGRPSGAGPDQPLG